MVSSYRDPDEVDWTRFRSTVEMDARTFSLWCDLSPRPKLGPPQPPVERAAPPLPLVAVKGVARGIAEALAAEHKADRERIAKLEGENVDLQRRLRGSRKVCSTAACRHPSRSICRESSGWAAVATSPETLPFKEPEGGWREDDAWVREVKRLLKAALIKAGLTAPRRGSAGSSPQH